MNYARKTRYTRLRSLKMERVDTAYGKLWKMLRFLGLRRLSLLVVRRPWHVADEYVNGRFHQPVIMFPANWPDQKKARYLLDARVKRERGTVTHTKHQARR